MKIKIITVLLILFVAGIANVSASPSLIIKPSDSVSLQPGESLEITLSMDEFPEGFTGYNMTVKIENPEVAEIEKVNFPDWASLHDNSQFPSASVWIKAVDLSEVVEEGASDVQLATLTLKGLKGGSTGIKVFVEQMDDSNGDPIWPDGAEGPSEDDTPSDEDDSSSKNHQGSKHSKSGSSSMPEPPAPSVQPENSPEAQDGSSVEGTASSTSDLREPETEDGAEAESPVENTGETNQESDKETPKNSIPGFGVYFSATAFMLLVIFRKFNTGPQN